MSEKSILKQALPTEIQTVKQDAFDLATFKELKASAEQIQIKEKEGSAVLKTFSPLMQDTFAGLYKYSPEVRPEGDMKSSHRVNHALINKAKDTDQWNQLRNYTKLDPVNSAMATITIANKLVEVIKTELKEEAELANKLCAAEDTASQCNSQAQSLSDIAGQAQGAQKTQFKKQASAAQKKAAQANQNLQQLQQQMDAQLPGMQQKARQAMRQAEQDALNEVKETSELMESWGNEPGQIIQLPVEKRLELAQRLSSNKKMKKLAKMIGRFRRLAIHAQKTKINHSQDEVHDLEQGSDLNRIIPSELMLLRNPTTKLEFGRKFTEGKLMQYKLKGTEKAGKGPIVVCIDQSGSMAGDKELWSKAVALGLLEIAQMQKRNFAAIGFGSKGDNLKFDEATKKNEYKQDLVTVIEKNERNIIPKVLHIAEYFLGGGTDFESPLDKAMEIIQEVEFKKADIVFVTDGECGVNEEWLSKFKELKKQKEVRIHTVLCDYGNTSTESVKEFSDQITSTSDLNEVNASEIFSGV